MNEQETMVLNETRGDDQTIWYAFLLAHAQHVFL